ncbi:MAG: hypothetical protein COB22_06655 [Cycloclasticus sp.]|nr:MAG: hypothetical protein COB22_06655 [Cycloclasticus sp.]
MTLATRDSTDNRRFTRSGSDAELTFFRLGSIEEGLGTVNNLSASGISFRTKHILNIGQALHITISSIKPPLNALIEVTRIENVNHDEYNVAATIEGIKAS